MDLAQWRQEPDLADLTDEQIVDVVHQTYYADIPREKVAASLGVKAAPVPPPSATIGDRIKDTGVSLMKGGVGAVQGVVGIADLATKGAAGKAVEDAGIDLKGAQQYWGDKYSPAQKAAFDKFEQADGVVDKTIAAVTNPSIIAQTAVESLPAMAVGGLIGRGAMAVAPRIGGAVAAGAGEGAIMAGSQAETIRGETADGRLTGEQAGLSVLTGVAGGAIGVFGAKLAKSFGLVDVDALMAGVATSPIAAKSVTRQVLQGAVTEGFLEELPQSVVEQVLQNKALGKPLDEGVDTAAVLGTLTGSAMGGAVNFGSAITKPRATAEDVLAAPDVDSAIAAAQAAVKAPAVVPVNASMTEGMTSSSEVDEDPFTRPIPTGPLPASVAAPLAEVAPAPSITGTDPATLMQRPNPLMEAATGEDQRQEELAARAMDRMSRDALDDGQALREFPASTLPRKMPTAPALPELDEVIAPGDILQKNGALWPEKGAQLKAKGIGGTVVAVKGGFIVRPAVKETAPNIEQAAPVAALVKAETQPKAADAQAPAAQAPAPVPAPAADTAPAQGQPDTGGAAVAVGESEQRDGALTAAAPEKPIEPGGFDPEKFDRERAERVKASREAGNVHLDKIPAYVETMRGKKIAYVHDNKVRGTIRTVDNRGNVYVNWDDAYSAEKEMASEVQDGKRKVMQSSLGPTDLKDYFVANTANVKNNPQPAVTPQAKAQSPQAPTPEGSDAPGAGPTNPQPGAAALEAPGLSPTNEPQSEPADPKRQVVELRKRASVLKSLIQCLGA